MLRGFLLSFFLLTFLTAEIPTIKTMENFPRSLAKDFYIWFYLKQNISASQADKLFSQVSHVSKKIFKAYAKKSNNRSIKKTLTCMNYKAKQILREKDPSCVLLALTPKKALQLSKKQRQKLIKKLSKLSPSTTKWLKELKKSTAINSSYRDNPETFLTIFLKSKASYRLKYFNQVLDKNFLDKLAKETNFDKFVETVAISNTLKTLQSSFVSFEASRCVSSHARFYIGLIKIKQGQDFLALNDFRYVAKNDYFQMNRDKALFWTYLVTKNKHYLKKIHLSTDLNIYTLYASELLGLDFIGGFTPKLPSKITSLYDESNPFTWTQLVVKDKSMTAAQACDELKYYENDKTQALYAFYLEKCGSYTVHPFITPYIELFKKSKPYDSALFYAIGRQESRLIAGGISRVFAMGMMQIMPFLSYAIAKQKKSRLFLPDMFKPEKNIAFAKHHLKQLKRKFKNPLFVAYAYNAGQGYFRRQLKQGLFRKKGVAGSYEPFLSMELLSYAETREYGKKVLANFVVYSKVFNYPIVLKHLFGTLVR